MSTTDKPATNQPARPMMNADDHAEPRGVPDLGLCQMDEQIAGSPVQHSIQGQPDLGDSVDIQPTGDTDLPT